MIRRFILTVAVFAVFVVAQYGLAVWMVDSRHAADPARIDSCLSDDQTGTHGRMVEIDGHPVYLTVHCWNPAPKVMLHVEEILEVSDLSFPDEVRTDRRRIKKAIRMTPPYRPPTLEQRFHTGPHCDPPTGCDQIR